MMSLSPGRCPDDPEVSGAGDYQARLCIFDQAGKSDHELTLTK
jgi:hypothetical protein